MEHLGRFETEEVFDSSDTSKQIIVFEKKQLAESIGDVINVNSK